MHHRAGLQPLDQPVDPPDAVAVLVGGEGVGPGRGPLHQVGHADAVVDEGVAGVPVPADEAGGEGGRPVAVARPGEADADVGGQHARVQPADQQPHARPDGVGQRALPAQRARAAGGPGRSPGSTSRSIDREPGPDQHVPQHRLGPAREPAPGEVVVGEGLVLGVTAEDGEVDRGSDGQRPVEVGEGQRDLGAGQVDIGLRRPGPAEAAPPERAGPSSRACTRGWSAGARSSMARAASRPMAPARGAAGATPARSRGRRPGRPGPGPPAPRPLRPASRALRRPVRRPRLVDRHGRIAHSRPRLGTPRVLSDTSMYPERGCPVPGTAVCSQRHVGVPRTGQRAPKPPPPPPPPPPPEKPPLNAAAGRAGRGGRGSEGRGGRRGQAGAEVTEGVERAEAGADAGPVADVPRRERRVVGHLGDADLQGVDQLVGHVRGRRRPPGSARRGPCARTGRPGAGRSPSGSA